MTYFSIEILNWRTNQSSIKSSMVTFVASSILILYLNDSLIFCSESKSSLLQRVEMFIHFFIHPILLILPVCLSLILKLCYVTLLFRYETTSDNH